MNTNDPSPTLGAGAFNDRVTAALRTQRVKIRVLTGLAFLVGSLAIATSVFFVCFYSILYLPKQKQLLRDAEMAAEQSKINSVAGEASVHDAVVRIDKFLGAQIVMTQVISMGTTLVAIVVGMLGLGMLILLIVVTLNRRATLNQINANLTQISEQLRQFRDGQSTGRPEC